ADYGTLVLRAGDARAAEQRFRHGYDWTREAGDIGAPIFAARLAEAVYVQGRIDEALEYTDVAARTAPEDGRAVQALWRATRAKALARVGELEEAETLARAAVAHAESTDFLTIRDGAL